MKFVMLLVLGLTLLINVKAQDFRNVNWGDKPDKVKTIEAKNKVKLKGNPIGPSYMLYAIINQNMDKVALFYNFRHDSLIQAQYEYNYMAYVTGRSMDYTLKFNKINQELIQQYGKPTSCDTLTYLTEWKFEDGSSIVHGLEKELDPAKMNITYKTKHFVRYNSKYYHRFVEKLNK